MFVLYKLNEDNDETRTARSNSFGLGTVHLTWSEAKKYFDSEKNPSCTHCIKVNANGLKALRGYNENMKL